MKPIPSEDAAVEHIRSRTGLEPRIALVLGSGLGALVGGVAGEVRVLYSEIPGFPHVGIEGHSGALMLGAWDGLPVAVLQGRAHLYEGWEPERIAHPVRTLAALGVETLVLTNAAGGVRPGMEPGDLMIIADHINLMWRNPLIGPVAAAEERFPDMSNPYDAGLREAAESVALKRGIGIRQGVYAAVLGPSYETPAEIRMLARLGADAVGMSTVPEVLVARSLGMRVLGISCITNRAAGLGGGPLSHAEVMRAGEQVRGRLTELIRVLLPRLISRAGGER